LTEEDRLASVDVIRNALKDYSKPVFLGGDFNAVSSSQVIKNVQNNWSMLNNPETPTIPSNNPKRCIDYIFAANNSAFSFQTIQTAIENEPVASDHLPVWVIVTISKTSK
jgi:endonuclease/exonuclease/phosphatase family metal-dependent hydrolase